MQINPIVYVLRFGDCVLCTSLQVFGDRFSFFLFAISEYWIIFVIMVCALISIVALIFKKEKRKTKWYNWIHFIISIHLTFTFFLLFCHCIWLWIFYFHIDSSPLSVHKYYFTIENKKGECSRKFILEKENEKWKNTSKI